MLLPDLLHQMGLNPKETKLYLELLELGAQPASALARSLGIPRSTAQFLAEGLARKSFVSKMIRNQITCYAPEKPENLKRLLDLRAQRTLDDLKDQHTLLDLMVPFFDKSSVERTHTPKVIFFEGVDNVVRSYLQFLQDIPAEETVFNFVSPAIERYQKFRKGMVNFIRQRAEKKIFIQVIAAYSPDAVRLKLTDRFERRHTLITRQERPSPFFSEMLLWKDRLLFSSYSFQRFFSSLLIDPDIAAMQRVLFELAWKEALKEDARLVKTPEVRRWIGQYRGIKGY